LLWFLETRRRSVLGFRLREADDGLKGQRSFHPWKLTVAKPLWISRKPVTKRRLPHMKRFPSLRPHKESIRSNKNLETFKKKKGKKRHGPLPISRLIPALKMLDSDQTYADCQRRKKLKGVLNRQSMAWLSGVGGSGVLGAMGGQGGKIFRSWQCSKKEKKRSKRNLRDAGPFEGLGHEGGGDEM